MTYSSQLLYKERTGNDITQCFSFLKKKEKEKLNWFVIDFVPSVGWGLDEMTSWFPSNLNQSKSYDNGIFIK